MLISEEVREHVMQRDGRRCNQCHAMRLLQIDHVYPVFHLRRHNVPLSQLNATWNLQVLCRDCNERKGATMPDKRTVESIRARDRIYQVAHQKGVDDRVAVLWHPRIEAFRDTWEYLAQTKDEDRRVHRDLDPNDYWREDIMDAIAAGISDGELIEMTLKAHDRADTSAWGYFGALLRKWMDPQPQEETLFDAR